MTADATLPPASPGPPPRLRLTLATKVTLLRLLGIPVFIAMMVYYRLSLSGDLPREEYRTAAMVLFLMVALSDALDGYLARSRGEITRLGATLDPLADKLLLWSAIATLTAPGRPALQPQLPVWLALVVFSRDALLGIGAYVLHHHGIQVEIRPTLTGKAGTALQMACVIAALAVCPVALVRWLALAAAAATLLSGVQYVHRGWRSMRAPPVLPTGRSGAGSAPPAP